MADSVDTLQYRKVTPEERQRALAAFEQGLAQVPRERFDVERMRWHLRITDPHGQVFLVAEYHLRRDGSFTRLWVLPDALWPSRPRSS